MQFSVLGPISVLDGDTDRAPTAPKQRQMLALLLLNANQVVSVAQLIEELWEYSPPPRAVAAVHTYVMQLRRTLHDGPGGPPSPERLMTRDQGYVLRVDNGELDLDVYEERIRLARSIPDGDPELVVRRSRAAEKMWRGQILVDVPTGPLLRAAIEVVERDRLDALVRRIGADLRLGRHQELLGELSALAHLHPTDERLTAQLMLALYRSGRQADALSAYHQLRRVLREELGTGPSRRLQRLHCDILSGHPRLEPPRSSSADYLLSLHLPDYLLPLATAAPRATLPSPRG